MRSDKPIWIPTLFLVTILSCFSCDSKKEEKDRTEQNSLDNETSRAKEPELIEESIVPRINNKESHSVEYDKLNESIREDIQKLDSVYSYIPFYGFIEGKKFFIARNQPFNYGQDWFSDNIKYGLLNEDLQQLLPLAYSKIGNPNVSLKSCFEISKGKKYGLYNYETHEVLDPKFDFIIPSNTTSKNIAYGLSENQVFRISYSNGFKLELLEAGFPLRELQLQFDLDGSNPNLIYSSYNESWEEDSNLGSGVMIMPSFIEELNIYEEPIIYDIIVDADLAAEYLFGTKTAKTTIKQNESFLNKITTFFATIYNSGIDGRGYEVDQRKLLVLNNSTNSFSTSELGSLSMYDYFCREAEYELVNDSIVQIRLNKREGFFYDFETQFSYKKISKNGEIQDLSTDRIFDFTKFVPINENHFGGCFGKFMENRGGMGEENIWLTDHLTIRELDIMRNEIFAEYGYRFQTKEWQDYFSKKSWYSPLHDDVNHLLTEIDKANIKTILEMKRKMEGNEEKYVNKRASVYVAAG